MPQLEQTMRWFANDIGGEFDFTPLARGEPLSLQFDGGKTLFIEAMGNGDNFADEEVLLSLELDKRVTDNDLAKTALARCLPQKVGFQLTCGGTKERKLVLVARVKEAELVPQKLETILRTLFSFADGLN